MLRILSMAEYIIYQMYTNDIFKVIGLSPFKKFIYQWLLPPIKHSFPSIAKKINITHEMRLILAIGWSRFRHNLHHTVPFSLRGLWHCGVPDLQVKTDSKNFDADKRFGVNGSGRRGLLLNEDVLRGKSILRDICKDLILSIFSRALSKKKNRLWIKEEILLGFNSIIKFSPGKKDLKFPWRKRISNTTTLSCSTCRITGNPGHYRKRGTLSALYFLSVKEWLFFFSHINVFTRRITF